MSDVNNVGSVVNLSSVAAIRASAPFFTYSATKAAVCNMTKSASHTSHINNLSIRFNSVHPGAIDTPLLRNATSSLGLQVPSKPSSDRGTAEGQKEYEAFCRAAFIGQTDDVAKVILFLLSDDSSHMYGCELVVDGGQISRLA
jgi:NAD(P)-dependent dehydrogenase (short-subunit alcohol dehydrogenase family)